MVNTNDFDLYSTDGKIKIILMNKNTKIVDGSNNIAKFLDDYTKTCLVQYIL